MRKRPALRDFQTGRDVFLSAAVLKFDKRPFDF
jgi:hypothetical protein